MRRKDREVTDMGRIIAILDQTRIVHLGLIDGEAPYVVPLHYGYKMEEGKLTLYMHGAREGHKIDLIRANPNAFIEIDCNEKLIAGGDLACSYGSAYASIMGRGKACLLEDDAEKAQALMILMKSQTGRDFEISEKMARAVAVIRVDVESYSAKERQMPAE
ncbi:MAG: pyridoxamine 5'-phosphate oxidase family protein [Oscillospiraceae bacterium]|nr:pyridoxamine 5'-phosphate oxidase family protein [Oscillospiraceae bacterium]